MTTVVFKDGVFAADSLLTCGGYVEGYSKKVLKCGKVYLGWSGSFQAVQMFQRFLRGEEFDKAFLEKPDNTFSAITVDPVTRKVVAYTDGIVPEVYRAPFYCIGSGSLVARGALLMGATPHEAVKAASKVDIYTGGRIQVVQLW